MLNTTLEEQEFFAKHGPMSDPCRFAGLLQDLPSDLPGLVQCVQGLLVHIFWVERYGLKLSEERQAEVQIRSVEQKIARILELDERPFRRPVRWRSAWLATAGITACSCVPYSKCKGYRHGLAAGSAPTSCRTIMKITGCANTGTPGKVAG